MYSLAYRCSLGYPSNGVKEHTFLPLLFFFSFFLKLWLTGKSAQSARSGYACRRGMMVALWTYTLCAQTWFAVSVAAEQRSRCGGAAGSRALTPVRSGKRNLHAKTKDGSLSKEQKETRTDESARSPAAATGFMVLCMRTLHPPSVSWATNACLQPPPHTHTTHFKAKR